MIAKAAFAAAEDGSEGQQVLPEARQVLVEVQQALAAVPASAGASGAFRQVDSALVSFAVARGLELRVSA